MMGITIEGVAVFLAIQYSALAMFVAHRFGIKNPIPLLWLAVVGQHLLIGLLVCKVIYLNQDFKNFMKSGEGE